MEHFKNWIKNRKAIKIRNIEQEAGIPLTILNKVLNGERKLPKKYEDQLLVVIKKYGYEPQYL